MSQNSTSENEAPTTWRVEITQDCWQVFWVQAATHDEAQAIANGVKHDASDWEYGDVETHADWSPSEPDENAVVWVDGTFVLAERLEAARQGSGVAAHSSLLVDEFGLSPQDAANENEGRTT